MSEKYFVLLWLAVGLPLRAQPLDCQQVEALALACQPRLKAAQLEVEATRLLVNQAQMSPNPLLNLGTEMPPLRIVSRVLAARQEELALIRLEAASARSLSL